MRNFFRRKPDKTSDTPNQQNNNEGNSNISFGENHPYFKNGRPILASDILKRVELQKKFPKLSIWLKKYPGAAGINLYNGCNDLLKIYCFEKSHLDNSYHEFRQLALKNQINEGFNLVLKFERSVNNFKPDVGTAFTDPPFEELTHLTEAHKYWMQARQQDFAMQVIKFEVNEIVLKKFMDLKQIAVHLVSLLASIDAVPLNCIPYISFSKLMVSKEVIIQSSPLSQRLENLASKYAKQSIESIQEIDKLRERFDFVLNSTPSSGSDINQINRDKEQVQTQAFKQMLSKKYFSPSTNLASNQYDIQNHCLSISADSSYFSDFVSHPKSLTYHFYKEYEANPSLETYRKLVLGVIETFSLKGEEATLATYLCSLAFAERIAPELFYEIPESMKKEVNQKQSDNKSMSAINTDNKTENGKSHIDEQNKSGSQTEPETQLAESKGPIVQPSNASSPDSIANSKAESGEESELAPGSSVSSTDDASKAASQSKDSPSSAGPHATESKVELHPTSAPSSDDGIDEATRKLMQSVGFDVFIVSDPILTLRAISQNMNVEYSTEGSVKYIINCLKMITPKWKEILKFIVDCSIQEYLPPKLRSIRYVINEIVSV